MTIKMKELLKKILNGEDVPKKIKYENTIYTYFEDNEYLSTKYREDEYNGLCIDYVPSLEKEVEIIEEDKKIPEKLNLDIDELRGKETPRAIDYLIEGKINQIIDYLKSKGDE